MTGFPHASKTATIIGAGMVGLATAWFLQERGYQVTVLDKTGPAAGSSWGNAGWLTPAKILPLADTSLWTYGPTALFNPDAALSVPPRFEPALWGFFAQFMAHATPRAWDRTMAGLVPLAQSCLDAFDEIDATIPVALQSRPTPFVAAFEKKAEAHGFLKEIDGVRRHGIPAELSEITNVDDYAPMLSDRISLAYRLDGQRFIEPGPYVIALAEAIENRGAQLRWGINVTRVRPASSANHAPTVLCESGEEIISEQVVIANGAWLPGLAREHGVRLPVKAGRGYSFSVATDKPAEHPVYLPYHRVACTPYQGRFRIAGTMEFRGPDEPLHPRRIEAIIRNTKPLMRGIDFNERYDEWVGSRPVTPDGLSLVGRTRTEGVFVAGGHGMWGIALGPATGKALAKLMETGVAPPEIAPCYPLR
ncbi:FAD-dependent oxidoreductase [Corynebacterium sp. 3HC-13]|uniref:NAD(P)/FAD-dependent oxidoreductase n=1 Tax=Corynebacterium poyangense TaxID=2684405 RepID=UPI001CCC29A8|nr:FAD-dependent oxidoreductase [Corynebacterium poyangense]MBZ8177327.1 FAD-dependent oxidoreductase [Corynebacterium poyangense]